MKEPTFRSASKTIVVLTAIAFAALSGCTPLPPASAGTCHGYEPVACIGNSVPVCESDSRGCEVCTCNMPVK